MNYRLRAGLDTGKSCRKPSGTTRAWFFSFKEKRAKTVSEQIFHAGENLRVFVSTDLILA